MVLLSLLFGKLPNVGINDLPSIRVVSKILSAEYSSPGLR